MAESRCKICGGEIRFKPGSTVGICSSCGARQKVSGTTDKRILKMYDSVDTYIKKDDLENADRTSKFDYSLTSDSFYDGTPELGRNNDTNNLTDTYSVSSLLKNAFLLLETGSFSEADRCCEQVIKQEPGNAEAYLGKLMVDCRVRFREDLKDSPYFSETNINYLNALRFGDPILIQEIKAYAGYIDSKREHQSKELDYLLAFNEIQKTSTLDAYKHAYELFTKLGDYKDSNRQAQICKEKIDQITAVQEEIRLRVAQEAEEKRLAEEEVTNKRNRIIMIIAFTCAFIAIIYFSFINVILPEIRVKKALAEYGDTLSNVAFGDIIEFGHYEQDNNADNGLEPIEWIVLQKGTERLLLISRYALDYVQYADAKHTYWSYSNMRSWLNNQFLNSAFTNSEKFLIETTSVITSVSSNPYVSDNRITKDKIFLPDRDFVDLYFATAKNSQCSATPYAIEKGAKGDDNYCRWVLHTHGQNPNEISVVYESGYVHSDKYSESEWHYAVRPVLYLHY